MKEQLFSEAELISQKYVSDTQDRSYKLNGTSVSFRKTLDSWGSLLGSTVESKARLGSATALQTQQCDRNTRRNNLRFLHGTATYKYGGYNQ